MPTSGRNWSRLDVVAAQRLYAAGSTCQQIADRFALSRSYVSARLRRAGTQMRPAGRPQARHDIDSVRLVAMRESGASWVELAATFGLTRYAVRQHYLKTVDLDDDPDCCAEIPPAARRAPGAIPREPAYGI